MSVDAELLETKETDLAIGGALRDLREARKFSAKQLAVAAGISAAMISRIESGQVSPSIATLNALSKALDVPLVSLFRDTTPERVDYSHVRAGEGLKSTRIVDNHSHDFINLAFHTRRDLQFEGRIVTLVQQSASPPTYIGQGVVFIYVLEGEAIYQYGQRELTVAPGDSLSLDAELNHGFKKVITPEFRFLTLQAERRR